VTLEYTAEHHAGEEVGERIMHRRHRVGLEPELAALQAVGYARCDTGVTLAEPYRHLRLITSFFVPQAKLIAKSRDAARGRYEAAETSGFGEVALTPTPGVFRVGGSLVRHQGL
jgi:hypothetical protein